MNYLDEVVNRWKNAGMLKDIPDSRQKTVAILLENQRMDSHTLYYGDMWKRVGIPLARRVAGMMSCYDMVSVQPMYLSPIKNVKLNGSKNIKIESKNKLLSTQWSPEETNKIQSHTRLDAEAEVTAVMAIDIGVELELAVFEELENAAGSKKQLQYNAFKGKQSEKFSALHFEIVRLLNQPTTLFDAPNPNWALCSSDIVHVLDSETTFSKIKENESFFDPVYTHRVGTMDFNGPVAVYSSSSLPSGKVIVGHHSGDEDPGFVFSPYILAALLPPKADADSHVVSHPVVSRYGFKMFHPERYAVLDVKGFYAKAG